MEFECEFEPLSLQHSQKRSTRIHSPHAIDCVQTFHGILNVQTHTHTCARARIHIWRAPSCRTNQSEGPLLLSNQRLCEHAQLSQLAFLLAICLTRLLNLRSWSISVCLPQWLLVGVFESVMKSSLYIRVFAVQERLWGTQMKEPFWSGSISQQSLPLLALILDDVKIQTVAMKIHEAKCVHLIVHHSLFWLTIAHLCQEASCIFSPFHGMILSASPVWIFSFSFQGILMLHTTQEARHWMSVCSTVFKTVHSFPTGLSSRPIVFERPDMWSSGVGWSLQRFF